MNTASAILNAVPVTAVHVIEGVAWFVTEVAELDYAKFKALPSVVRYNEKNYRKVGYNTDRNTVHYRQSNQFAVPA